MELIVKYSRIELTDYEIGSIPDIEKEFSCYDRISHQVYNMGVYYDRERSCLYLPRGIDIWWVEAKTKLKAKIDNFHDKYRHTEAIRLYTSPREHQKEPLRFMVGAGEYSYTENKSQLSLNLNTGKGKTYISIATISYFEITTILIMSSNQYIEQWVDRICQYTDLDRKKDIKIIKGSGSILSLLNKSDHKYKIYLVTHSTLNRFGVSNGWDKVGELFTHLGIGIKMFDEAHQNFENICMVDFYTNTWKTYYITASPAKSSEEEDRIYKLYFKNVPNIDMFDPENDPHTKYIAIKFSSNPTILDIQYCKNAYGLDRNRYIDYLSRKDEYYQLLRVIMNMVLKCTGKVLIYIGTNEVINKTYKWIVTNYPELYNDIGIFTSIVSPEEKYLAQYKKIILSTTKSAGAAVDISGLKMTIVLAEPFKSPVICQQSIGRTRDEDTYYIECVDVGFRKIVEWYNYKQPTIEKYCTGNSIIRLNRVELENRANSIISAMPIIYLAKRELVKRV